MDARIDHEGRSAPNSRAADAWQLLALAGPLILSNGSTTLMYVCDRVMLTWYSKEALAASLPAGMLGWSMLSLPFGVAMYVNTFVSQYTGAGRPDRVAAALWQGIYFALAAGLVLATFSPFVVEFCLAMGHEREIALLEADYLFVILLTAVFPLLAATLSGYFSGRSLPAAVFWANTAGALMNIVLDYWWIFGRHGRPGWGITGAAWATAMGSLTTCAVYLAWMSLDPEIRQQRLLRHARFDRALFGRLLWFGGPSGLNSFWEVVCFTAFVIMVGWIGPQELAASNLAFNVNTLAFMPMLGFGVAVSTLVGQRIGENRPELAIRTTWLAFWMSTSYMAALAVLFVVVPDIILAPYATYADAEFHKVADLVRFLLIFVAIYCLFDTMNIVFSAALRGAGDTWFVLVFSSISSVLLMVLPTYWAYKLAENKLLWSWVAITFYIAFLGLGFMARFHQGVWKRMRVIEPTVATPGPMPAYRSNDNGDQNGAGDPATTLTRSAGAG